MEDLETFTDSQKAELLRQLQYAANCFENECKDIYCNMGKEWFGHLEDVLYDIRSNVRTRMDRVALLIVECIFNHAATCDELKCMVPYCSFFYHFTENDSDFDSALEKFLSLYANDTLRLIDCDSELTDYITLCRDFVEGHFLKEGTDWVSNAAIGHLKNTVLAQPTTPSVSSNWIVKKCRKDEQHLDNLRQLSYDCHQYIANHLWAASTSDSFIVALTFEGDSLQMSIDKNHFKHIDIYEYVLQLLSAMQFLHDKRLVYLAWTATNIIFNESKRSLKLCDFKNARNIDDCDEDDIGDVVDCLDPSIRAPEMYDRELHFKSDIWGLGCVWYHMICKHKVHHQYRHLDSSKCTQQIKKNHVPNLDEIENITDRDSLRQLFQVKVSDRMLPEKLKPILEERHHGLKP